MEFNVIFPNGETKEFRLKSKEFKGKFLINGVFNEAKIEDETSKKYFGLRYADKDDAGMSWITPELNMKRLSYLATGYNKAGSNIQLLIRFFPKNPDLVFPTSASRSLFRQLMKNMLINEEIGCDINTHAILDGLNLQCVYGDIDKKEDGAKYFDKYNDLEIYLPSLMSCGNSISQREYYLLVQKQHEKLKGLRETQAEIKYLNEIQNLPLYGYNFYNISDKTHESYFLGISEFGICFVYDSYIEKHLFPKNVEEYSWSDLVYCQLDRNIVKFGFFPQFGGFIEKKVKVKCKYSQKGAYRLEADLHDFKKMFSDGEAVDGQGVFQSRKEAQKHYTTMIPQKRHNSLSQKFSSMKRSLRVSFRRTKSNIETSKLSEQQFISSEEKPTD